MLHDRDIHAILEYHMVTRLSVKFSGPSRWLQFLSFIDWVDLRFALQQNWSWCVFRADNEQCTRAPKLWELNESVGKIWKFSLSVKKNAFHGVSEIDISKLFDQFMKWNSCKRDTTARTNHKPSFVYCENEILRDYAASKLTYTSSTGMFLILQIWFKVTFPVRCGSNVCCHCCQQMINVGRKMAYQPNGGSESRWGTNTVSLFCKKYLSSLFYMD